MKQETHLRWNEPETISWGLPKLAADRVRRYINNPPAEVDTPLRRAMQEACWL